MPRYANFREAVLGLAALGDGAGLALLARRAGTELGPAEGAASLVHEGVGEMAPLLAVVVRRHRRGLLRDGCVLGCVTLGRGRVALHHCLGDCSLDVCGRVVCELLLCRCR